MHFAASRSDYSITRVMTQSIVWLYAKSGSGSFLLPVRVVCRWCLLLGLRQRSLTLALKYWFSIWSLNSCIDSYGYCLLQYCHSSQFSTHSSNRRTNVLSGLDAGSVDGRFSSKYCFITVLQPFQISTHSSNRRTNVLSGLDAGSVDGRLQQ
jgi:hypothetical protein